MNFKSLVTWENLENQNPKRLVTWEITTRETVFPLIELPLMRLVHEPRMKLKHRQNEPDDLVLAP